MKSTHDIIEELKRMECINYSHYSAPKPCTKDARDKITKLEEALKRIRDGDWKYTFATPSRDYWMQEIAREALE